MMNLSRKAAVVGVYEHPTRFAPDKTVYQIMAESMKGALDDAGLTIKDVDGIAAAGIGGGMGMIGLCDYLNLTPNFVDRHQRSADARFVATRCTRPRRSRPACARSQWCCMARRFPRRDSRSAPAAEAGAAIRPSNLDGPFGVTTVGSYAMVAQRHMHEYGTTSGAARRGRGDDAPACVDESGGEVSRSHNGRGRARVAGDFVAAASARLLHHLRWRRRAGHNLGGTRARFEEEAGLYPRRRGDRSSRRRGPSRLPRKRGVADRKLAFERAGVKHADIDMGDDLRSRSPSPLSRSSKTWASANAARVGHSFRADASASMAIFPSTPTVAGCRRIIRDARDFPRHRGDQAASRRMWSAPGQGLQARDRSRNRGALGTRHAGATLILGNQ